MKKQVNMRFEEALIGRVDEAAKAAGSDRTAFFERAVLELLDDSRRAPEGVREIPGVTTAARLLANGDISGAAAEHRRVMAARQVRLNKGRG